MRGFISAQIKGKDEIVNGIPQKGKDTWSELVPCKYTPNEWDDKGTYSGGKFTKYAFDITTSKMTFKAELIQLYDDDKVLIGEFKVSSLQKLKSVGRIKIKV